MPRRTRLRTELLEARLTPVAGLFTENFTSDTDPAQPGYDSHRYDQNTPSSDDFGFGISQTIYYNMHGYLIYGGTLSVGTPAYGEPAPTSGPHRLSFTRTYAVGRVDFAVGPAADGQGNPVPYRPGAGEEVAAVAVSVSGVGSIVVTGEAGGRVTIPFNSPDAYTRILVGRDHQVSATQELEGIVSVGIIPAGVVYPHGRPGPDPDTTVLIDDVTVLVVDEDVNAPPVANDDRFLVDRATGFAVVGPGANDFDERFDLLYYQSATQPAYGTVNEFGTEYRLDPAYRDDPSVTRDQYTYTIVDERGATATATVTLVINAPPVGRNDYYSPAHGQSYRFDVTDPARGLLANDGDADGEPLRISIEREPTHGRVVLGADGTFTYYSIHPTGLVVNDQFDYFITDGVWPKTRHTVYIRPPNEAPTAAGRTIDLDDGSGEVPDGPVTGTVTFADPDGDRLDVAVGIPAAWGTVVLNGGDPATDLTDSVSFTYYPANGRLRDDQFTLRVTDPYGAAATATVRILVPNNAPQVGVNRYTGGLSLLRQTGRRIAGDAVEGELYHLYRPVVDVVDGTNVYGDMYARADGRDIAVDFDADEMVPVLVDGPDHGTVAITRVVDNDGDVSYRFAYTPDPDAGVFGKDTFAYRLSDGTAESAPVYVDVLQHLGRIVDPPVGGLLPLRQRPSTTGGLDNPQYGPFYGADLAGGLVFEGGVPVLPWVRTVELSIQTRPGDFHQGFVFTDENGDDYGNGTDFTAGASQKVYLSANSNRSFDVDYFLLNYKLHYPGPGLDNANLVDGPSTRLDGYAYRGDAHSDKDGLPDDDERGDGNRDGVADSAQGNVATFRNREAGGRTTLASPAGTALGRVESHTAGELPPAPVALPLGAVSFDVFLLNAADRAVVTLYPPDGVRLNTYYKYREAFGGNPAGWFEFLYDPATGTGAKFFDDDGNGDTDRVELHFVDGRRGDSDGGRNYVIRDPGGPGFVGGDPFLVDPPGSAPASVPLSPAGFAVGAGVGGGPVVTLRNPDGSVRTALVPFDAAGRSGVRTAVADFDRDGVPDVVAGTGPGVPARVRVLSGATGAELFAVDPFGAFAGGVHVAAGDVTGDGRPELVVTPDEGGGPRLRVFDGAGFGVLEDCYVMDPAFRGGLRAAVGDVDGDGRGELVVAAGAGGGPRVAVFRGDSIGAAGGPARLVDDFFAFDPSLRDGAFVAVGDVDGDGKADVIAGAGAGGGPHVMIFGGRSLLLDPAAAARAPLASFFAGGEAARGGVRVAAANLDGDRRADLVTGSGGGRVTGYSGLSLDADTTPPEEFGFDAFAGFGGGAFVG